MKHYKKKYLTENEFWLSNVKNDLVNYNLIRLNYNIAEHIIAVFFLQDVCALHLLSQLLITSSLQNKKCCQLYKYAVPMPLFFFKTNRSMMATFFSVI